MSKEKYQEYFSNINAFLKTEIARYFTVNYFMEFFQNLILSNVGSSLCGHKENDGAPCIL
jgi:hypothetical protein